MRPFIVSILLLMARPAFAEDPLMVVAAARAGRLEFFDASLAPVSSIGVHQQVESVSASPDGRRLYVAQESIQNSGSCCGLFSLDLQTKKMCAIDSPAMFGVPSPDGRFLFTQGKRGVDVYDAGTLTRVTTMKAPGAYNLQPSADGRWLLGVTNSPKPSVDVFDLKSGALARRIPVPAGPATGAWAGARFYIFSYGEPGQGRLWSMKPEDHELSEEKPIALPDFHGKCDEPVLLMVTGAQDRLFIAEAFGFHVDRRGRCPDEALGGVQEFFPSNGNLFALAPTAHVNRLAASPSGRDLYVLEAGGQGYQSNPRLLHVDTMTQRILQSVFLDQGEWSLTLARIPPALVPRRNVHATTSCSR